MKYLILGLMFLLPTMSYSAQYKISGKIYKFSESIPSYSDNCYKQCVAKRRVGLLKKFIRPSATEKHLTSLGTYTCTEMLGGKSLLGLDTKKNMVGLCFFADDASMIEFSSLEQYANKLNAQ